MLLKVLNKLEEGIISFLLVAMTLMVVVEVIMRFVFNTGLLWIGEATLYTAAWFVLFGASYGIKVGAHIGVEAFVNLLPNTPRKIAAVIAVLACLVYCGLFLYGGWIYLAKMKMIGIEMDDIPVPKWMAMSILFIGFVLLVVRFLVLLWNILTDRQTGFHIVDEAQESMHLAQELEEALKQEQEAASQSPTPDRGPKS